MSELRKTFAVTLKEQVAYFGNADSLRKIVQTARDLQDGKPTMGQSQEVLLASTNVAVVQSMIYLDSVLSKNPTISFMVLKESSLRVYLPY